MCAYSILVVSARFPCRSAEVQAQTVLLIAANTNQHKKPQKECTVPHDTKNCGAAKTVVGTVLAIVPCTGSGQSCVSFNAYGTVLGNRLFPGTSTILTYRGFTAVEVPPQGFPWKGEVLILLCSQKQRMAHKGQNIEDHDDCFEETP